MIELAATRHVDATREQVFALLADFGGIADWARFIQHSSLLTEQPRGVGATRRVQMAQQTVVETVTVWDDPAELAYTIDGLPPIVGAVSNRWTLVPSATGTTVTLTTLIEPGRWLHQRLIAKKVADRLVIASELMLAGLAERAGTNVAKEASNV